MLYIYEDRDGKYLNVREQPSLHARIVGRIDNGSEVRVESVDDEWAKVPGGYCMAKFLAKVESQDYFQGDTGEDNALEKMTVKDLRKLAVESGIKLKANLTKAQIIECILEG